jgi:hypothetical protein
VQVKAEIGEDACDVTFNTKDSLISTFPQNLFNPISTAPTTMTSTTTTIEKPTPESELQKKIMSLLNKKSFSEKIAKTVESRTPKLSQIDKDELKSKILKDQKVKNALSALLGKKN